MCKEFPMLFEILNTKVWTFEKLRKFYANNNIYHGDEHLVNGVCIFSSLKVCHNQKFMLFDKDELLHLKKQKTSLIGQDALAIISKIEDNSIIEPERVSDSGYIFPSTERGPRHLASAMQDICLTYVDFVDKCIDGYLDIAFLNKSLDKEFLSISFRPSSSTWIPTLSMTKSLFGYDYLENCITDNDILKPVLQGNGVVFSRIRKCLTCGKYFIPKSLKKKFCSDKCRGAYHYAIEH